jgi:hypothetical protein
MDENPYRSPESESEVEKRPRKPPNRNVKAAVWGTATYGGLSMFLAFIVRLLLELGLEPIIRPDAPLFVIVVTAIAGPVGVAVAWWTWRVPESKWPVVVAMLLASSPFLLLVIVLVFLR